MEKFFMLLAPGVVIRTTNNINRPYRVIFINSSKLTNYFNCFCLLTLNKDFRFKNIDDAGGAFDLFVQSEFKQEYYNY